MINNTVKTTVFSLFLVVGVMFTLPSTAHALFLDSLFENAPAGPHCLFMDCNNNSNNSQPQVVNNTTNSNNTNSFNTNTTVGTINNNAGSATNQYAPAVTVPVVPVNNNYNYNYNNNDSYRPATQVYSTPVYAYNPPVYSYTNYVPAPVYNYYPTQTYSYTYPLTVSCRANTTYSPVGSYVSWTAYPSGGYNNYNSYNYNTTYTWSGTDNVYGSISSISAYYNTPGIKYAYVNIYSNGQSAYAQCSNAVTVGAPSTYYNSTYTNYNYSQPTYISGLQISCAVDTTSTRVGVPVTWTAEAIGNGYQSGFTYAWTGSDGLSGNQPSVVTTYVTPGQKSAVVTITSPNGQSQSKACSNTVSVKSATVAKTAPKVTPIAIVAPAPVVPVAVVAPAPAPATNMTAASLFSLQNVPWGWVGVLIILVLLGIIFYLMFNRKKI